MKKELNNIDKFFEKTIKAENYTEETGNWDLISYKIQEAKRKKKIFFQFWSLFSLIVGICFISYKFYQPTKNILALKTEFHSDNLKKVSNNNKQLVIKRDFNLLKVEGSMLSQSEQYSVIDMNEELGIDKSIGINRKKYNTLDNQNQSINDINSGNYGHYSVSTIEKTIFEEEEINEILVTNMGDAVNSNYTDFGPVITADGEQMFFTSNRIKDNQTNSFDFVYKTTYNKDIKEWVSTNKLSKNINLPNKNNSVIGLSNDGQTMFLYRDNYKGIGDIFISNLNGKKWSKPIKMPYPINSKYHESAISLSPDGNTAYFVSERLGGIGKKDIWYCQKNKKGDWGEAMNIGNLLNTSKNEESVYIHPDGKTLFFSSKGHNGLGGYDIYKSINVNGVWSKPMALPTPINTENDDIYFVLEANGKIGYFVSKGKDKNADIYKVEFKQTKQTKSYLTKLTLFKGVVLDKKTQDPLQAEIEIIDLDNNRVLTTQKSNSSTGKFLISLPFGINYGINISKDGYLFYSDNVLVDSSSYKEVIKVIELNKINIGDKIILQNIFYDFNKSALHNESKSELDKLVDLISKYPKMKIEIGSHTDSKGTYAYNQSLSQKRAQAVVDYLIKQNIDSERLVAKGYGETEPIAPNIKTNGDDNPEGRKINRRTEFKILKK